MRCSKCGTANPAGNNFCAQCGNALTKLCAKLGAENLPASNFCSNWRALKGEFNSADGPASNLPQARLGADLVDEVISEVFEGDLTLTNIKGKCRVTLESLHGSIAIANRIERRGHTYLKAAGAVTIGEAIGQHSIVEIVAGGDVTIGEAIGEYSQVTITSTEGKITIGLNAAPTLKARVPEETSVFTGRGIHQHSIVILTAPGDVTINGSLHQQATADIISIDGAISIERIETAVALLTAGTTVHISGKIGEHSELTVLAQDDVTVGETIEQHAAIQLTSLSGSILIGQGLRSGATAMLTAVNGAVNIGGRVDEGAFVEWNARQFNGPAEAAPSK
jgi:hypothetical protein